MLVFGLSFRRLETIFVLLTTCSFFNVLAIRFHFVVVCMHIKAMRRYGFCFKGLCVKFDRVKLDG